MEGREEVEMSGLIVDLFAGGGGASLGIERALGRSPDIAINHSVLAIACHARNHPKTTHLTANVWEVDPLDATGGRPVDLLWASPDCRHFSRAKGGKPVSKRVRSLAWVVTRWAKATRPRVIALENVAEFETWGPLGADDRPIKHRAGETFRRWVGQLRRLGYDVEWRILNAADFGAPTSRKRLFLVARNDGEPIRWPVPTHGTNRPHRHRSAAECIDWSDLGSSIFGRKKELAPATLRRIARGIVRFVLDSKEPFLVLCNHSGDGFRGQPLSQPMQTIAAAHDARGLVTPFVARYHGEKTPGEPVRGETCRDPLPTQTTENRFGLVAPLIGRLRGSTDAHVKSSCSPASEPADTISAGGTHHALIAPVIVRNFGGMDARDVCATMPTITGVDHHSLSIAHLTKLQQNSIGQHPNQPIDTVMAGAPRFGVVAASVDGHPDQSGDVAAFLAKYADHDNDGRVVITIDGVEHVITDIKLRMLQPDELQRAQGFGDDYVIDGTKRDRVRLIGNSVCPPVAEALVRANMLAAGVTMERQEVLFA